MISIIAFIIVMFGSLNWLSIGFFQYDIVAGLFGFQGSIFSRIIYIIVGICAVYLIYVIIKNKGRITVKKLKKEEQPMVDKMTKKSAEQIEQDQQIANNIKYQSENNHTSVNQATFEQTQNQTKQPSNETTHISNSTAEINNSYFDNSKQ